MLRDLMFTTRTLLRQPAFTLAAVATLALGIGATTAIFSTVNAALLRQVAPRRRCGAILIPSPESRGRGRQLWLPDPQICCGRPVLNVAHADNVRAGPPKVKTLTAAIVLMWVFVGCVADTGKGRLQGWLVYANGGFRLQAVNLSDGSRRVLPTPDGLINHVAGFSHDAVLIELCPEPAGRNEPRRNCVIALYQLATLRTLEVRDGQLPAVDASTRLWFYDVSDPGWLLTADLDTPLKQHRVARVPDLGIEMTGHVPRSPALPVGTGRVVFVGQSGKLTRYDSTSGRASELPVTDVVPVLYLGNSTLLGRDWKGNYTVSVNLDSSEVRRVEDIGGRVGSTVIAGIADHMIAYNRPRRFSLSDRWDTYVYDAVARREYVVSSGMVGSAVWVTTVSH
jgi:hypothetical protein